MEPTQTKGKLWLWLLVLIVVILIAVFAWRRYAPRPAPSVPSARVAPAPVTAGDTTTDIQKDLGTVDLGNPGQDVNQLNQDINQL